MITKDYRVIDQNGLHARPASAVVRVASKCSAQTTLIFNNKEVDMKSILGLLSLGIKEDDVFSVMVHGEDEENASKEIGENLALEKVAIMIDDNQELL